MHILGAIADTLIHSITSITPILEPHSDELPYPQMSVFGCITFYFGMTEKALTSVGDLKVI